MDDRSKNFFLAYLIDRFTDDGTVEISPEEIQEALKFSYTLREVMSEDKMSVSLIVNKTQR